MWLAGAITVLKIPVAAEQVATRMAVAVGDMAEEKEEGLGFRGHRERFRVKS
jgi:hypothetical protein